MKRMLICAAIPREFKYIHRSLFLTDVRRLTTGRAITAQTASLDITLLQTGLGIHNAMSSMESLLTVPPPDLILSLGFGGALHEELAAGDLVSASRIIFLRNEPSGAVRPQITDISLPESKKIMDIIGPSISLREGCIVTLEHPMAKSEIRNILPSGISFPVCDMETFVLATIAAERHIPFFAARSISDTSSQKVPQEFFDLIDASGKTSYARLFMSVLKKPGLMKDLFQLGLNSEKAAKSLGGLVKSVLDNA